jgi:hypothetical protein
MKAIRAQYPDFTRSVATWSATFVAGLGILGLDRGWPPLGIPAASK